MRGRKCSIIFMRKVAGRLAVLEERYKDLPPKQRAGKINEELMNTFCVGRREIFEWKKQVKAMEYSAHMCTEVNLPPSHYREIAKLPEEQQRQAIEEATDKNLTYQQTAMLVAEQLGKSTLLRPVHVGYATGETEWYTPPCYIQAARTLMGTIDVDPASSDVANEHVQATHYFTIQNDGLKQPWHGNVWMNPPYAQPLVTQFCTLLVEKYLAGEVRQACVLVNNATETEFYQKMLKHCQAVCFIAGRVKFLDKNGDSSGTPLQGQTILYFGTNATTFSKLFSEFGVVLHAT